MYVVRPFVSVHRLEIQYVANHMIFIRDAVATVHVSRHASDVERLAAIVAFYERDALRRAGAAIDHATHCKRRLVAESDLGLHVGKFFLDQLIGGQRTSELLPGQRVISSSQPAELCRTHRAPSNPVAGAIQAAERTPQAADVRQQVFFRDQNVVHDNFAGN
jgi:hypothetical protein